MDFNLQRNIIDVSTTEVLTIVGTGATALPSGNTAARPGTPSGGFIRYNSENNALEFYNSGSVAWETAGSTALSALGAVATNGILVRTGSNTYTARSIAVSGAGNQAGLAIANGDGVSGNPTLGISITGLADMGEAVATGDTMILYNASGTANVEVTVDQLKTFMNAGTSSTSITEGNTTVAIADPGTGTVTTTVDATVVIVTAVGTTTFQNGNDVVLNTGSTLTVTDLAADRIVYTTTAGLLTSSTAYTFNGTTLALTGDMDITGSLDVDNINVNGNTISVTNTDGNLVLTQNGTGQINLVDGGGLEMFEFARVASAVNHVSFTNAATGTAPTFSTNVTGSDTNVDLNFTLKGTGVLTVVAGSGNYEDNVTADDDVPNKKYVDDAVAGVDLVLIDDNPSTPTAPSATGANAIAMGSGAISELHGGVAHSAGIFTSAGYAQTRTLLLRVSTTNGTITEMFLDGASARMVLANDTSWAFRIMVVARRADVDGEGAVYQIVGGIDRHTNAASTALIGFASKTVVTEDEIDWDVTVSADTTNGSLRLQVTGEAAKTIRWVARVDLVEVTG